MSESRSQLLARKRDLLDALRVLDRDRDEGTIDREAYARTRRRFELEAATILQRLDVLQAKDESPRGIRPRRSVALIGGVALVLAAIGLILGASLTARSTNQSVTGAQPPAALTPEPSTPPAVLKAQRAVAAHPHNVDALLALGQAYFNAQSFAAADRTLRTAMRLAPWRPEAATLDALVLSRTNRAAALQLVARVERRDPGYARVWLTDGLIAAQTRSGYPRAISAWKHFLRLMPRGGVAAGVRQALAGIERAQRARR